MESGSVNDRNRTRAWAVRRTQVGAQQGISVGPYRYIYNAPRSGVGDLHGCMGRRVGTTSSSKQPARHLRRAKTAPQGRGCACEGGRRRAHHVPPRPMLPCACSQPQRCPRRRRMRRCSGAAAAGAPPALPAQALPVSVAVQASIKAGSCQLGADAAVMRALQKEGWREVVGSTGKTGHHPFQRTRLPFLTPKHAT